MDEMILNTTAGADIDPQPAAEPQADHEDAIREPRVDPRSAARAVDSLLYCGGICLAAYVIGQIVVEVLTAGGLQAI